MAFVADVVADEWSTPARSWRWPEGSGNGLERVETDDAASSRNGGRILHIARAISDWRDATRQPDGPHRAQKTARIVP
jgi:hypothetical protein